MVSRQYLARLPSALSLGSGCLDEGCERVAVFTATVSFGSPLETTIDCCPPTPRTIIVGSSDAWSDENVTKTVTLWNLSSDEHSNLIELGQRLQDLDYHKNIPAVVIRFMMARPGNVPTAEAMFRKMVEWRIENSVDDILQNFQPPRELLENFPGAVLQGLDKVGDPVFLSRAGVTDIAAMLRRFGRNVMIQHAIWIRELISTGAWMKVYEQEQGRPVQRIIVIEDVHGLPLLQIAANRQLLSMYSEVMRLDQDNYPEAAKKIIVLRAPALFRVVWNIVQHFFDPGVRQKMAFTGGSNYKELLSAYLDLEILPECVVPGIGKGKAAEGLPSYFEGGPLPFE